MLQPAGAWRLVALAAPVAVLAARWLLSRGVARRTRAGRVSRVASAPPGRSPSPPARLIPATSRPLIAEWNTAHPTQKVTPIYLPDDADDQYAQLVANLQAHSTVYDVMSLDVIWTAEFASSGWITPISQRAIPARQLPAPGRRHGDVPGTPVCGPVHQQRRRCCTTARTSWPRPASGRPTTWAQLADARQHGGAPVRAGRLRQPVPGLRGPDRQLRRGRPVGGRIAAVADGTPVTVDSPQARRALQFLVSGLRQGWIPQAALSWDEEASRHAFEAGQAAVPEQLAVRLRRGKRPAPATRWPASSASRRCPAWPGPGQARSAGRTWRSARTPSIRPPRWPSSSS